MPPKIDQAAIIILDVGKNVSTPDEKGGKSFFYEAKDCAARVIERKIMSQGKNLLGIILLGSKKTNNNMAEQCDGAFRHVDILAELQNPTWKMIRDLPSCPVNSKGDWMDALIVAADHFKNGISGVKLNSKKIILMTNFKVPTSLEDNDIKQVLNGFREEEFEVDIIGPDIYDEYQKGDLQLAREFVESTSGATATFDHAMRYLLFHKKKAVNAIPWNVDLSIGPNIKIPISSYIRLKDEPAVKKWIKAVKNPVTQTASSTEGIMLDKIHVNSENQTLVDPDAVIKGYHYGQQIIPFSDCDKTLLYEPGEKCLSVYGFTKASNIKWQSLSGDGLAYVFGRKGDKKAQSAIRCLVDCLHELELVAVARRVYNKGNAPKMYALMPVIDTNNYICLSMVGLCYKEDVKYMTFPSTNLKKFATTDEQVNAFKDLIKGMDLTKAYDETFDYAEAFPIAETVSPSVQYVLDCIAYRAMNPGKPLPQPRDEILMLFKVPPLVEKRSREPLERIKQLFSLTKVEKKTRDKIKHSISDEIKQDDEIKIEKLNTENMPSVQLPTKTKFTDIEKIGTVNPINDYKKLIAGGKNYSEVAQEMTAAIENIVYCNLDSIYAKALDTMKFFREECVKIDPAPYNIWLQKFKKALSERKKEDVKVLIKDNQLDFILKEENESSTYENMGSHDSQLYENDTVPDATELTIDTAINELFDDM